MKRILLNSLLFFCLLFSPSLLYAQRLTQKEIHQLENILFSFVGRQSTLHGDQQQNLPWEYMTCFLVTDSNGRIMETGVLNAGEEQDSIFIFLSRIRETDFKQVKFADCKDQVIVIPFVSRGDGPCPAYMDSVIRKEPWKHPATVSSVENVHWTTVFYYQRENISARKIY